MRRSAVLLFWMLPFAALGDGVLGHVDEAPEKPKSVWNLPLSPDATVMIPCNPHISTTVAFPSPIQAFEGVMFSKDLKVELGDWLLSRQPRRQFFTVIPLSYETRERNANVMVGGKLYALQFVVVHDSSDAVKLVRFANPKPVGKEQGEDGVEDRPQATADASVGRPLFEGEARRKPAERKPVTPERLLGFLTRSKLLATAKKDEIPKLLEQMKGTDLQNREGDVIDCGEFKIHLLRITRDDALDALSFYFVIENNSTFDLVVDPESLHVRSGAHIYRQVMSDVTPVVHAGKTEGGVFIVAGDGEGGRSELSVKSPFRVGCVIKHVRKAVDPVTVKSPTGSNAPAVQSNGGAK